MKRFEFSDPKFTVTDVSHFSEEEWLSFRLKGVGCSEVGSVLGANKWSHEAHVFSQKVGETQQGKIDNMAMHMGRILEPVVIDMWQSWDIDRPESYLENKNNGEIIREAYKPDIYMQNSDYPWLLGGPDALFEHEGKVAILEVKTISSYSADQYEGGIPPSYVFQIQAYMMLFDCEYAEMAILKDGRDFDVVPFHRNEEVCSIISENCSKFWAKVTRAKKMISKGLKDEAFSKLYPDADDSSSYQEFLKERFKDGDRGGIESTDEIDQHVEDLLDVREREKAVKSEKLGLENKIKSFMGDHEEVIFHNADYKVSWRKSGKTRRFNIKDLS